MWSIVSYGISAFTRSMKLISGDQATTSNSASNITDLNYSLAENSIYTVSGVMKIGCSSTGGVKFACSVPSGATVAAHLFGSTTGNTAFIYQAEAATGSLTAAYCTEASAFRMVTWEGTITTGATAGTFQMKFASGTNGQTSTIYKDGTFFRIQKVA